MADPVSWLVIETGWKVVSTDGQDLGRVQEVLGDQESDIFNGLAVNTGALGKPKVVPAENVAEIVEGEITLDLTADAVGRLADHEPAL